MSSLSLGLIGQRRRNANSAALGSAIATILSVCPTVGLICTRTGHTPAAVCAPNVTLAGNPPLQVASALD